MNRQDNNLSSHRQDHRRTCRLLIRPIYSILPNQNPVLLLVAAFSEGLNRDRSLKLTKVTGEITVSSPVQNSHLPTRIKTTLVRGIQACSISQGAPQLLISLWCQAIVSLPSSTPSLKGNRSQAQGEAGQEWEEDSKSPDIHFISYLHHMKDNLSKRVKSVLLLSHLFQPLYLLPQSFRCLSHILFFLVKIFIIDIFAILLQKDLMIHFMGL